MGLHYKCRPLVEFLFFPTQIRSYRTPEIPCMSSWYCFSLLLCLLVFEQNKRLLLLSCAKSHMLSASRRQPHLLHVSAVDRRQTRSMDKSWRCVTLSGFLHSHIATIAGIDAFNSDAVIGRLTNSAIPRWRRRAALRWRAGISRCRRGSPVRPCTAPWNHSAQRTKFRSLRIVGIVYFFFTRNFHFATLQFV